MLGLKIKVVLPDEAATPPHVSPHQSKAGDGSAWQSQLAGTYLHIGGRLPVHIIGDDEISFEEGVRAGWAGALLVQAGFEGHMALREGDGGPLSAWQSLPSADLSLGLPWALSKESCHPLGRSGLPEHLSSPRSSGAPWRVEALSEPGFHSPGSLGLTSLLALPTLGSHIGRRIPHHEKELHVG